MQILNKWNEEGLIHSQNYYAWYLRLCKHTGGGYIRRGLIIGGLQYILDSKSHKVVDCSVTSVIIMYAWLTFIWNIISDRQVIKLPILSNYIQLVMISDSLAQKQLIYSHLVVSKLIFMLSNEMHYNDFIKI